MTTKAARPKPEEVPLPAAAALPALPPVAEDGGSALAEIERLAAALGCEAFLLPREAEPAEVTALLERIAARLDAGITLVPHPRKKPPACGASA